MKTKLRGFSLIEAMIASLVLSVGLLGLARLQAQLWSSAAQLHATTAAYRYPKLPIFYGYGGNWGA